jgi:hypothetical protein
MSIKSTTELTRQECIDQILNELREFIALTSGNKLHGFSNKDLEDMSMKTILNGGIVSYILLKRAKNTSIQTIT